MTLQSRRSLLRALAAGGAAYTGPGLFADALKTTAILGEGPFYPDKLPLDTDNDLLVVNDGITPALGEIAYVSGRVLTKSGEPLRNGYVEIWQTDTHGSYLHSGGRNTGGYDSNFQGYGRFVTDSKGQYFFRTIKPVQYTLQGVYRCPHIHFAISKSGHRLIATQMLVKGDPGNDADGIVKSNRAKGDMLESVMVDFKPLAGSKLKEYSANWDIVIGRTAQEMEDGTLGIGLGRPDRPKFNPAPAPK
ncbi:MAG: intradiol ring-cleavage dioxygenase [Terriglobia bacterium]